MQPITWKFCTPVYSLIILLFCMIRVNGNTDIYIDSSPPPHIDSNSDILKILMGVQNERGAKTPNFIFSMNMNAETINFNVPFTVSDSEPNKPEYKTAINNVRENDYTVTEGFDYKKLHHKRIKTDKDDYTLIEGIGYYKLHNTELNWHEAHNACIAENAHLAAINSRKEDMALRQLMLETAPTVDKVYIGAHAEIERSFCGTLTSEEQDTNGYDKSEDGELNDENGKKECSVLHKGYGIEDIPCSFKHYYICEIPL